MLTTFKTLSSGFIGGDLTVIGSATVFGNLLTIGNITGLNLSGTNTGDQDLSGFIPYNGATQNVNLGNYTLSANRIYTTQLDALSANITVIDIKQYELSGFNVTGNVTVTGNLSALSFVTSGGLSSQFVKGNGTLDSNTYLTSESDTLSSVTARGNTSTRSITVSGVNTPYVQFNVAATPLTNAEGLLQWNATDGTLDLGMDNGNITMQLGQEMFTKVRNTSGSTITNGSAVYISGRAGNRPSISLARGDVLTTSNVAGLVTQDIPNNSDGFITTVGYVREIKTDYTGAGIWGTTWVEGDILYVSKTDAGQITNVEPSTPNHSDIIGTVGVVHNNLGSILVTPHRHRALEELSNVNGTPLTTSGQILNWNNTTGYFDFDKNINDYLPLSGGNITGVLTVSGGVVSTGTFFGSLGTVSLPSYSFTGDTNTGMWSPSADNIAWSTGGVERIRVSSAGVKTTVYPNTSFTQSYTTLFGIEYPSLTPIASNGQQIGIQRGGIFLQGDTDDGDIPAIYMFSGADENDYTTIKFDKNLGVELACSGDIFTAGKNKFLSELQYINYFAGSLSRPAYTFGSAQTTGITNLGGNPNVCIVINGVEAGRFDTSRRFGLGTSTPNQMLTVVGNISATGGLFTSYVEKSTNYTPLSTDSTINCLSTLTVTLPTAVNLTGRTLNIKNSGIGVVTLSANGAQTIDGNNTILLTTQWQNITLQATSSGSWIIL